MTRSHFRSLFAVTLLGLVSFSVGAQQSGTLYSPQKYRNEPVNFCLNFQTGLSSSRNVECDLRYGFLGLNDNFDWLQASAAPASRSLFKDLGSHTWAEDFAVPVVAALPKLKPGEQRTVSIDASGANGAPGKRGNSANGGFTPKEVSDSKSRPAREPGRLIWSTDNPEFSRSDVRSDSGSRVDPIFVKAVAGHMYVAHIVDESSDYYALFRIDALANQTCTISWKLIPTPNR